MAAGTSRQVSVPQVPDQASNRAFDRLVSELRDTQTDVMRDGRELSGVRRTGITILGSTSLDVAHGLGRRHRGGWCCRPLSIAALSVFEDPANTPAALRDSHIHLVNNSAAVALFYWWVY